MRSIQRRRCSRSRGRKQKYKKERKNTWRNGKIPRRKASTVGRGVKEEAREGDSPSVEEDSRWRRKIEELEQLEREKVEQDKGLKEHQEKSTIGVKPTEVIYLTKNEEKVVETRSEQDQDPCSVQDIEVPLLGS